jgi:hypothetical protein
MFIIIFACKVDPEEPEPEDPYNAVLGYMIDILGVNGTYNSYDHGNFTFKIANTASAAESPSNYGTLSKECNYVVMYAHFSSDKTNYLPSGIKVTPGSVETQNEYASVDIPPAVLLYSAGSKSMLPSTGSIVLNVGAATKSDPSAIYGTKAVSLPVTGSNMTAEIGTINALRLFAGSFSYNAGGTINSGEGIVNLLTAGPVGTLIAGTSPSGSIVTNFPNDPTKSLPCLVLGDGGSLVAGSIVTNSEDIFQGSLSAGSFTLGTLSNGALYIDDAGSVASGDAVTGTVTVYFSDNKMPAGNLVLTSGELSYTVPKFGVLVNISRPAATE